MHNNTFYTILTLVYAVMMLVVFFFSTRRIDLLDDANLPEGFLPEDPVKRAGRLMLIIWGCYVLQVTLLMLFDMTGR